MEIITFPESRLATSSPMLKPTLLVLLELSLYQNQYTHKSSTRIQLTSTLQRPRVPLDLLRARRDCNSVSSRLAGPSFELLRPFGDVRDDLLRAEPRQLGPIETGAIAEDRVVFGERPAALELASPLMHHLNTRWIQPARGNVTTNRKLRAERTVSHPKYRSPH